MQTIASQPKAPSAKQMALQARRDESARARRAAIEAAQQESRDRTAALRQTKKALTTALIAIYRERLREACKPINPAMQSWGVIRTQAWLKLASQGARACRSKNPNLVRAVSILERLERVADADLDQLGAIIKPGK